MLHFAHTISSHLHYTVIYICLPVVKISSHSVLIVTTALLHTLIVSTHILVINYSFNSYFRRFQFQLVFLVLNYNFNSYFRVEIIAGEISDSRKLGNQRTVYDYIHP